MGKRQHCKGIWHAKEIRFRSDSILIVVQIQVGSVRATAKVTEWVSLFLQCPSRTRLLLRLEDHWKTPGTRACRERSTLGGRASTVSPGHTHYAPLQQMRVFGGTGEPRELVRCVGQRAYRCAVLDWKPMGLSFQMTTASSCCEGVARNQTAPRPIKYQLLVGPLRLGGALSLSSYQPPGAPFSNQNNSERASPIWGKGSSALTLSPGSTTAPPIKQERSGSFHGGVTIDSIYYYGKLVYQNVNLRSYLGSPPTTKVSLGRCIILHFSKRIFIHFFLPHGRRRLKRRKKTRPGKGKGFGKVGPIRCLHSSNNTEEERNKVRGRGAGKRVESIRLDDREKENEIRIWPKKKEGYGYHDRSPSRKKNLSKLLLVSGAFKHPKDAGVVNDISFLIENDDSFRKTKLFHFFFPKKYRSDGPTSHLLKSKRTLPAVRLSLNYLVMQYFLNTKNQIHFDPVVVLNHFVSPGVAEPFTMGERMHREEA
uniref:Ribosomal protein S3 n=1 Tax=Salix viminalis TaxID=40686 RepID=A0A6N2K2P6_SALVM